MKKWIAALLLSVCSITYASPADYELASYVYRATFYMQMGQTPDQIAVSLCNYFGKPYFIASSNGWAQTADIQYVEGSGTEIKFMATLITVKAGP